MLECHVPQKTCCMSLVDIFCSPINCNGSPLLLLGLPLAPHFDSSGKPGVECEDMVSFQLL